MPAPTRALRLVHCADVHLDSDYYGGPRGQAGAQRARELFAGVLDQAVTLRADVLLIAGDLFDHNRVSAVTLDFAVQALADCPFPVLLLPGNHDCLDASAVLLHPAWAGSGVHGLYAPDGSSVHLPALDLTVWGRGMREHSPQFRPMAHAPARPASGWHVGMAHGLVRDDEESFRSAPIAPAEIAGSDFDYLALGHVHAAREVSAGGVPAWYPGNTLPFGHEAGSALCVDLVPGAPAQVTRLRVAAD